MPSPSNGGEAVGMREKKGDPSLKTQCAIALIHAFVWPVSFMLRRRNIVLLFIKRPTAFDLFYAMIHHLSVCLSIITSLYTVHAHTSVCPPRSEYIIYTCGKYSNKKYMCKKKTI